MEYSIYRGATPVLTIQPEGQQVEKIMDVEQVELTFTRPAAFPFQIGDRISVYGKLYFLFEIPQVNKISSHEFVYTCTFKSQKHALANASYLFLGPDNALRETDFSLNGTADVFIDLLLANVNRVQSGWVKGNVDSGLTKNLTFSDENCLSVLSRLADEFETEYWIDGQVIHLTKRAPETPIILEYGKGLHRIERTQINKVITRLYAYGGTRNLPGDYRNFSRRLKLPTGHYLEKNVFEADGITKKYGVVEFVKKFEEIFPQRIGVVTKALDPFRFLDTTMDFDLNKQLLPGTTPKLVFQNGQLAGYQFEIASYNAATGQFTINKNQDEKALEVPSPLMQAKAGDEYILVDIIMPPSYITAAENLLKLRSQEFIDLECEPRFQYDLTVDLLHFLRNGIALILGSYVTAKDVNVGINTKPRVVGFSRNINNPYDYTNIELAEKVTLPAVVRQKNQQRRYFSDITGIRQLTNKPFQRTAYAGRIIGTIG